MRSMISRFAVLAVAAASLAAAPTVHALGLAAEDAAMNGAGNGTGVTVVSRTAPVDHKAQALAAKAAWKAAKAQEKQPVEFAQPAGAPFSLRVQNGVLSIDGRVSKEGMHYTIEKATSLSFYLPGVGTLIMTPTATPGSTAVKAAIRENVLSFAVDGHKLYLTSSTPLADKPVIDAYVHLDKSEAAAHMGNYPQIGYSVMGQSLSDWTPAAEPAPVTVAKN